jgi:hypothetical protein
VGKFIQNRVKKARMSKSINIESLDRTEDLTIEEVRTLQTFRGWNEEQISELIRTTKAFTRIIYNNWAKGRKIGKQIVLETDNLIDVKTAA